MDSHDEKGILESSSTCAVAHVCKFTIVKAGRTRVFIRVELDSGYGALTCRTDMRLALCELAAEA